ncbi:hypothetical protein K443DRAFT_170198 [Laccaria amethystina LaAM-08-1]|uniref:Uncharacterized protein n=1 Tax=Laccaria amethystina LaAM-08-1 TaxID=1095629 RepID=A0A0C9YI34_9AGAR|nr:hypothetical protein K443DRAFT_170198 [Laccaria amethystina LaAM-08-1]
MFCCATAEQKTCPLLQWTPGSYFVMQQRKAKGGSPSQGLLIFNVHHQNSFRCKWDLSFSHYIKLVSAGCPSSPCHIWSQPRAQAWRP